MNEPVAWMTHLIRYDNLVGKIAIPQLHLNQPPPHYYDEIIPLYTHPVKELTDEEIGQIYADNLTFMIRTKEDANSLIDSAKAILRKAQEK